MTVQEFREVIRSSHVGKTRTPLSIVVRESVIWCYEDAVAAMLPVDVHLFVVTGRTIELMCLLLQLLVRN